MPGRRFASLAFATLAVASLSCLVTGDDVHEVRVSLDLGEVDLAAETLPGPREADGLVHLSSVPAYVHVVVTGPGIDPPLVASWPVEGAMTPRAEVRFAFDVPAGAAREFAFLAYVRRSGEVRAWAGGTEAPLDLEGGTSSDLAVTLPRIEAGTIAGTVSGVRASEVVSVMAVDGDPAAGAAEGPGVALPPAELAGGAFEIPGVPVGRAIHLRAVLSSGESVPGVAAPVTLSTAGERVEVPVVVP